VLGFNAKIINHTHPSDKEDKGKIVAKEDSP
jgi:hypothetical protein